MVSIVTLPTPTCKGRQHLSVYMQCGGQHSGGSLSQTASSPPPCVIGWGGSGLAARDYSGAHLFESGPGGCSYALWVRVGEYLKVQGRMMVARAQGPHVGLLHVHHTRKLGYLGEGREGGAGGGRGRRREGQEEGGAGGGRGGRREGQQSAS